MVRRGIMVGGVPVGSDRYIDAVLGDKAQEIVQYIETTVERLRDHPQALWASIYYCCQSRFDYWLRHVAPWFTRRPANLIDAALIRAAEALTYDGCILDPLTLRRFQLPARMRGCGIRHRVALAPVAFAACFVEAAECMLDRAVVLGGPRSTHGFFPQLARSVPKEARLVWDGGDEGAAEELERERH